MVIPCLEAARVQDGVIIQKIGSTYVYVFPTETGRIKGSDNPAGVITIGTNIAVAYALKIMHSGSARFIGFYGPNLQEPKLKVVKAEENFGFLVKDKTQPVLDVQINPTFMAETKKQMQDKIARQGNLNVTLKREKDGYKVLKVVLD